jgi:hypothetical protein
MQLHECVPDCKPDAHIASPIAASCECHDAVTSIRQDLDNLLEVVSAIHNDLAPTLESLKSSPLLKMFFK